ncbi:hypothetical protein AB3662_28830 [Sorangium cellulosum]|uniref:hypothetical protein n=1 Tax=Sorangium cellulosum TaxID=56 RepID=UPI003D9A8216
MIENEIAKLVVDAEIEVHRSLGGPGLLETVHEEAIDPLPCLFAPLRLCAFALNSGFPSGMDGLRHRFSDQGAGAPRRRRSR